MIQDLTQIKPKGSPFLHPIDYMIKIVTFLHRSYGVLTPFVRGFVIGRLKLVIVCMYF